MSKLKKSIISSILALLITPSLQAADVKKPAPKADIFIIQEAQDLPIVLKYPASIKSFQNVKVVSRVLGVLESKHFTEGQKVNQGDLLYKIEDNIYKSKVDAAKASVQMSKASMENASRNWKRVDKLYKSKSVSDERRDEALSTFDQATASYALAKAQLNQAQIDFDFTQVKAPISGIVGLKKVDIGDLVTNNPPQELTTITQNEKVYIDFSMPLSDYKNIKNGLWSLGENNKVNINLEINGKATKYTGVIDFIDVNINQNTSTVKMRAIVDNKDNFLMPGNFVRVSLNNIVEKNVITVPQKAVLQNPLGTIVFVENDGKVSIKPIKLGKETADKYVIAGGPLQTGDRVIVNNFFRVKPGGNVTVDKIINK
ncbi:MAG: efflux RND transporter periplasmic adaptor subunit [Arcobacteraceae bacterium]